MRDYPTPWEFPRVVAANGRLIENLPYYHDPKWIELWAAIARKVNAFDHFVSVLESARALLKNTDPYGAGGSIIQEIDAAISRAKGQRG